MELPGLAVTPLTWGTALLPIALLVGLVLQGRLSTAKSAAMAVAVALPLGLLVFGGGPTVLAVAAAKGAWLGLWILYVVWPALLLYLLARRVGLTEMGRTLDSLLERPTENVLLIAWVLPSFIQGVAGFGTPIAVAAPLLMSVGLPVRKAVALPLIGYHWSVTFGSMGSSFYMGGFTAGLTGADLDAYAGTAAFMLSVNAILAGVLVALMYDGWRGVRESARMIVVVGGAMAFALNLAARVEPAVASLAAGATGLVVVLVLRQVTRTRAVLPAAVGTRGAPTEHAVDTTLQDSTDDRKGAREADLGRFGLIVLPYAYLLVSVMAVLVPTASRSWVKANLLLAPAFPATITDAGFANAAVETFTPIALLGHPGSYIFLASLLGYVTYRCAGLWRHPSTSISLVREWFGMASKSSTAILLLGVLAMVMVDTGMIRLLASGAADVAGRGFPALSPVIGSIGAFMTGSTTNSNALFAALQRDVAVLIDVSPSTLVAAQTVGGNIGNSVAPVVILVGATAVAAQDDTGRVLLDVVGPAGALMLSAVVLTLVFAFVL